MIGLLVEAGISEKEADIYAAQVRRGGILVGVQAAEDMAAGAKLIMDEFGPISAVNPPSASEEAHADVKSSVGLKPSTRNLGEESGAHRGDEWGYTVENLTKMPESYIASEYDQGFTAFDRNYRSHYASYLLKTGKPYQFYLPGYQYGYALAADERFRRLDWEELEPRARQFWLSKPDKGAWNEIKEAVRYSWEDVRAEME
jgi:hypothetical protein